MDDQWAVQMWQPGVLEYGAQHGEWMHVRRDGYGVSLTGRCPLILLQRNLEEPFKLTYEEACDLSRAVTQTGKTTRIYRVGTEDYIMGDILL
jgi:hypothetical protein